MKWIFLSPHLDDAALSCGGLLWEQSQAGLDVSIWTICAGDPAEGDLSPFARSLHERWKTGPEAGPRRRAEDAAANRVLGAGYRNFPLPDCIYRQDQNGRFLYDSEEALWVEVDPSEEGLVRELAQELERAGSGSELTVVCPLAIGGHVDHRLTRQVAETWQSGTTGLSLWYYADYPYVLQESSVLEDLFRQGWRARVFPVSKAGLDAWKLAVAAHASQISTFWDSLDDMRAAIQEYWASAGGVRLWQPP